MRLNEYITRGLICINGVLRFVDSTPSALNLYRIIKKYLHPHFGEAWLEMSNKLGHKDPHIHIFHAIPSSYNIEDWKEENVSRLRYLSNGKLKQTYIDKDLREPNVVRQYNSDQLSGHDKNKGNEFIFAKYP